MDRILRFGLIAAVAAIALLVPTRAASNTPPPVIEVTVSLTDLPPAVVNVTTPEQHVVLPIQPAPVVNVDVTIPEMPAPVVNVEPSQPHVVYQDRVQTVEVPVVVTVEVERIVEVERLVEVERIVEVPVEVIVVCNPVDGRERTFAFIDGGLVTNLAGGSGKDFENYLAAVAGQGMEVTCVFPRPAIGWTFVDGVFASPS